MLDSPQLSIKLNILQHITIWVQIRSIHCDWVNVSLFKSSPKDMLFFYTDFKEKGRTRDKHGHERETSFSCLPYMRLHPGSKPQPEACALTGNRTRDLLVYKMMLQTTKSHGQDSLSLNLQVILHPY